MNVNRMLAIGQSSVDQSVDEQKAIQLSGVEVNAMDLLNDSQPKDISKPQMDYHCNECSLHMTTQDFFEYHMNREHLHKKPYLCYVCDKAFYTRLTLTKHLSYHQISVGNDWNVFTGHPLPPNMCDICGSDEKTTIDLRNHKENCHKGEIGITIGITVTDNRLIVSSRRTQSKSCPVKASDGKYVCFGWTAL